MKDKDNTKWLYFILGAFAAIIVMLTIIVVQDKKDEEKTGKEVIEESTDTADETSEIESTVTEYDTSPKDFNITLSGNEVVKFHTPEDYYDLSEQYSNYIRSYCNLDESVKLDNTVTVGDADTPAMTNVLICAAPFSDIDIRLQAIYGNEYDAETMLESDAYMYMKTGIIPEYVPEDYNIEELDSITSDDGITYRFFKIHYTDSYEYSTGETDENGEAVVATATEEINQISAYSDTEDVIEVIGCMTEWDETVLYNKMKEFLQ